MAAFSQRSNEESSLSAIRKIAYELTGIQLNTSHDTMIRSRLQRRLQELKLSTLEEYLEHFHRHRMIEADKFIALITTHHTFFFREFEHFECLRTRVLPEYCSALRTRPEKTLRLWSAACSRGQEVYSLAMFLDLHLKALDSSFSFEILGSDIDRESIEYAKNGVYPFSQIQEVPSSLLGKHWARGTGEIAHFAKVRDSLRRYCRFSVLNLLDLPAPPSSDNERFDVIFCRNVLIYFNAEQVRQVIQSLLRFLTPGGYLFLGVSESLLQHELPLQQVGPSVYRFLPETGAAGVSVVTVPRKAADTGVPATAAAAPGPSAPAATATASKRPIRVLTVDDSPTIHAIMKQILAGDPEFEHVGTAMDGTEIQEKIEALKPDVLTLDIHMPKMTGIQYLQLNRPSNHPPIVMLSSVSREESTLALEALRLGAADYIEKPALNQLQERSEEIRTKLRCAVIAHQSGQRSVSDLDAQMPAQLPPLSSERSLRLIVFPVSHRQRLKELFAHWGMRDCPVILLSSAPADTLPALAPDISTQIGRKVQYVQTAPAHAELAPDSVLLMNLETAALQIFQNYNTLRAFSIMVIGDVTTKAALPLLGLAHAQFLLEDLGNGKGAAALQAMATDIVPISSFAYLSTHFLASRSQRSLAA